MERETEDVESPRVEMDRGLQIAGKLSPPTNTYTDLALCDLGGAGVSLCPNSTKGRTCSLKLVFPPSRTITDMLVCRNHVQL